VAAKRVLAVLVAVALVAGAWVVRTKVIKKSSGTTTSTSTSVDVGGTNGGSTAPTVKASKVLGCLAELKDLCATTKLEVATIPAQTSEQPTTESFITLSPWGALPAAWTRTPLASSTVVLLGRNGSLDDLKGKCAGYLWSCIGGNGDVRFHDPTTTADGALSFAAAFAGRLGSTTFGTGDITVKPADGSWATALRGERRVPSDAGKLNVGAAFDIAATLQAFATKTTTIRFETPQPAVITTAVLVTKNPPEAKLVSELRAAFGNKGWDTGVQAQGLPDATAVEAARSYWKNGS
jgi:hypothetical protein